MTDKQVMIDGVDVSGCLFYQINFEEDYDVKIKYYCSNWHNSCESNNNSNCYYKQLKRKEQECEELQAECARLEELNNYLLQYRRNATTCQECYDDGLQTGLAQNKTIRKYKQTLTEIKEIAEKSMRAGRMLSGGWLSQKISECEGNDEKH